MREILNISAYDLHPVLALAIAYGFVFLILGVGTILEKTKVFNDEGARKFIHIGVANWWIIAMFIFKDWSIAIIPPLTFIVLNYLSYRYNLVSAMERVHKSENDLGTVYYAISLSIVTFFAFKYNLLLEGAVAILIMGYGDGLSAVFGKQYPTRLLYLNKTLLGTSVMLISSLIIALLFIEVWWLIILIPVIATLIELFTPKGLDNFSVPLIIFLLLVVLV